MIKSINGIASSLTEPQGQQVGLWSDRTRSNGAAGRAGPFSVNFLVSIRMMIDCYISNYVDFYVY